MNTFSNFPIDGIIDDRNGERITRTGILDGFVIISSPTDVPGVLLTCFRARVTSVEYSEVPEKAYIFTLAEFGVVPISAHIRSDLLSLHRASTEYRRSDNSLYIKV